MQFHACIALAIEEFGIVSRHKNCCQTHQKKRHSAIHMLALKEIIHSYQMSNMSYAFPMIPVSIPNPAFVKRKVSLVYDTDSDHMLYLKSLKVFA